MNILEHQHFYLVGIKGVAMTSLAQCLIDAGKSVQGSDVAEEFVTQPLLDSLKIKINKGFETKIPSDTECVIYTAAHGAQQNPQVKAALKQKLATYTHAEAIASLFNQKKGIAVCGVGGKSTTSAMITWILEKTHRTPSFSVGVGNIPGLNKTGRWSEKSEYFVCEADEYVTDPSAPSRGEKITPRFSYLRPFITVCTNLRFDHPDVYKDFAHTEEVYAEFFDQIQKGGTLIVNGDDKPLWHLAKGVMAKHGHTALSFGQDSSCDMVLHGFKTSPGFTHTQLLFNEKEYYLELQIPGEFNVRNAMAALLATTALGVDLQEGIDALLSFRSTQRRSEYIGEKNGVKFYDDYAHHPNEVEQIIRAFKEWFPDRKLVVAFQSHTFSRTKSLFNEFVQAFSHADEVVMIDIFPSAREAFDESVTSESLCDSIQQMFPHISAQNVGTLKKLEDYLSTHLEAGDVCLTVGAGDIYRVHEMMK